MEKRKPFAFLSGLFMILLAAPIFLSMASNVIKNFSPDYENVWNYLFEHSAYIIGSAAMTVAAVFLFRREPKKAAIALIVTTVAVIVLAFPTLIQLFNGQLEDGYDYYVSVPRGYIALPVLMILAPALLSVALFLHGPAAMILAFLSAAAQFIGTKLMFSISRYQTGHPTLFTLLPVLFGISAVFAGIYLLKEDN